MDRPTQRSTECFCLLTNGQLMGWGIGGVGHWGGRGALGGGEGRGDIPLPFMKFDGCLWPRTKL